MYGFGKIEREKDEPVFHEPWEGRVLGISRATFMLIPRGMRDYIERLDPAFYLSSSYFERWLNALPYLPKFLSIVDHDHNSSDITCSE